MKQREQAGKGDRDDQLMLSVIDFDDSHYDETRQNGKCVFCGGWSAKDHKGLERFMGMQGYFKDDEDNDDSDSIHVIYSCDKCSEVYEDEIDDEKEILFDDRGTFVVDSIFRMND